MTSSRRRWVSVLATLTTVLVLLGGCAAFGEPAGPAEKVELLKVEDPLREPVWVPGEKVLLALGDEEPRIVRLDPDAGVPAGEAPGPSAVEESRELEDVGENLALNVREPDHVYVPRPESDRISVLSTRSLRKLDSLEVEGPPVEVTVDVASEVLFSRSADGSEVVGMDLESMEEISATEIDGGEETLIVAPEKGLTPAFWTAGPDGVAHYAGSPPERKVGLPIQASDIAVDATSAQRTYVAESGTGRVAAVEGDPEELLEGELEVIAERRLGERVEHIASGELFVYAATRNRLVVMRRHDLRTVESVEYRRPLEREALESAGLSGLAVGKESVYLTLSGEPYVLSIDKP